MAQKPGLRERYAAMKASPEHAAVRRLSNLRAIGVVVVGLPVGLALVAFSNHFGWDHTFTYPIALVLAIGAGRFAANLYHKRSVADQSPD
ncbi:MAG TPA: hypothetical protein VNQ99_12450 [Xanthobacteraceae bacterium]|nr:hypothetical protein [Xanthobacteraceae bacterium]